MERLLLEYFAKDTVQGARMRRQLVVAYLIGMEIHDGVYSYSTKPLPHQRSDERNARRRHTVLLPLCERATQIGCVVAYRTFLQDTNPCESLLHRPNVHAGDRPHQRVVCTNPLTWTTMNGKKDDQEGTDGKVHKDGTDARHLGCMPIVHPWANLYYLVFGGGRSSSSSSSSHALSPTASHDRLQGYISDMDLGCTITSATCNEKGMLIIDMPFWQRVWAHGYVVPFPAWTVFRYVKSVFTKHVGGTRCVTWSIDRSIQIHARITWGVECIRAMFFHLFLVCFD